MQKSAFFQSFSKFLKIVWIIKLLEKSGNLGFKMSKAMGKEPV